MEYCKECFKCNKVSNNSIENSSKLELANQNSKNKSEINKTSNISKN